MNKPCLGCGRLTPASRCPACAKVRRARYDGTWKAQAAATIQAWVAQHGWTCPGYGGSPGFPHPPHNTRDLVVDHDLGVMCRQANGIKAATIDRHRSTTSG